MQVRSSGPADTFREQLVAAGGRCLQTVVSKRTADGGAAVCCTGSTARFWSHRHPGSGLTGLAGPPVVSVPARVESFLQPGRQRFCGNMETELFMECDEEELEPWQQVDDSMEEDEVDFMEPVEDSPSPLPASETPPPRTPPPITPQTAPLVQIVCSSVRPPLPPALPSPLPPALPSLLPPALPPPPYPSVITSAVSRIAPSSKPAAAPPLMAQAPPLFLTQTAGGTFLLPAAPGTRHATPILLTTQQVRCSASVTTVICQGFPVMNRGAPLLLNLQPGQTVQPLTLIQSPSLGQLVRPSVGVSPVPQGQAVQARPGPAPSRGSAFTAMQLPATLTFRTGTPGPVNLQMTQVGGTNALKLAVSPALPSGSANGVTRIFSSAPSPAPSFITAHSVTSLPTSDPPRVVMTVEEFYYGTFEGDLSLRKPLQLGIKTSTFTCHICHYLAENNLRLMQHMLHHSELIGGRAPGDDRKCCKFCYRQFSSPDQLQSHEDQVHGPALSSCLCRICEWAFENEPAFLNHMKSNHKPGEMPYVCQVCSYRSSFSADIVQHFASFHKDSRFLMCLFCLKVTRNPVSYQQHLLRHQVNQAFHCNRCRLQFIFLKDKMQHKLENHRSFRRPAQLEGLPPGSKVTIRTYGKIRPLTLAGGRLLQSPASLVQPINIKTETCPLQRIPGLNKSPRSPTKRPVGRVNRTSGGDADYLVCLECGTRVLDFSAHYPTHVRCLLCPYSSCCSRAYASHMIHHHVPQTKDKVLPLHRLPPPCVFRLQCSHCGFSSQTADHMADHLLRNPEHHSATCHARSNIERDIQFCPSEEHQPSEETEPVQKQDLLDLSWRLADCWTQPSECDCSDSTIASFEQSAGPHHFLSKNTDAIDFFHLLFPSELMELITNETNAHAKTSHFLGYGYSDWVPTTIHEIKGFIGLVVLMGIQNLPDLSHYWSWSHYDNSYTFYRAMSFKRFKQIAANIRMGSFTTAEFRGTGEPGDSLHIFRPMLNILEGAVWDAYQPNCCLSVDRALLPSPEEVSCDGKADPKTQPQVWLLCDSKSGYCHRFFIQVGEKEGQEQGFTVVPELVKDLVDKHHQLYLASSLASVPLMQKLLDQGIYASSSFPPLSHILPRELWEEGCLEKPGDFLQRQFGPLLATRWRDTKEMGCLSTNADPGEQDTVWRRSQTKVGGLDPIDRPMAFCLLQENMRGVDICKQLLACNPLGGIPQDRHWRRLFWFLVNLSIVNAFIVLRESRKENPPAWVQDGLFTQVNFRKRLGNQLAKCAQNYSETVEIASSRGMRVKPTEVPVKQRHRMGKISSISKRCKTCHLRNLRHESVYGCIVCRTNLCKQPSCFWEFHGLSPINKGSTRVGFIKDRISGEITVKEVEDNVDGAMAPVEDMDFSDNELDDIDDDDELEDIKDKFINEEKRPMSDLPSRTTTPPGHPRPATTSSACKERDDFLTARQLRIALFALCDGLRQASRVFLTEPPLIRSWLKDARRRLKSTVREQKSDADGGDLMVAWVLSMREQQLPITESNLFHKVSILKKKGGFSDSFRISYDWAVGFMLRHRLGVQSSGRAATLAHALPLSLEAKIKSFRDFTQKVIRVNKLSESTVAAMDELCLFVDLRLVQDKSRRSEALELTGSLPLVTVYLAVLANGTMLPSVVLANPQLAEKVLPDFILLETGPESLLVEQALDLWTNKVWLKHMAGPTRPRKSMLVLDRHREHMGDSFLTSISGSGTLPAVIPGGDSFRLQPLEICVKPVLQHFLLSRWARFTRGNPKELEETSPHQLQANVAQLLVDWAVEALTQLKKLPQLWKESFRLTGLLPGREVEEETMSPEEIQSDLLKTLTETLLGPEALKADYSELLELEDNEDTEEEQGEEQRASKEKQGEGKDAKKDREETREEIKAEGKETKERRPVDTEKDTIKGEEDRKKTEEDMNKEVEKLEEDSEEEGKETEEDRKEVSKERRETRIVIGEEVGDEWKITVKSRADGVEDDEMDES
ncbi:pogo transposable element derived with ZNF domain b isoform X2 [Cyclopterus lumpus]|uniref:pogo transposable element derived with ZNF domain b isoform X2 n=1 Tax=Cyclopterus lumpus TaxID=8103 RepID=UPI00148757E0|nr:pogo transposable element derived with ZNF domain b isoform X2 [Cyclopterus lumpus]